jgi:agmatine/peptidylarginine deiminase
MMKNYIFLIYSILFFTPIKAQENLPQYMTKEERLIWPNYLENLKQINNTSTPPPYSNLRAPGEWEEIDAICITWTSYQSTLKEIVRNAQTQCNVIIVCSDSTQVKSYLTSNNIPLTNKLKFVKASFNSIWIRDYGPNCVYSKEVDSLFIVDWVYNRPRPADDAVPLSIANFMNLPIYGTTTSPNKLVHTGGNYQSNGFGQAFSSKLVLDENNTLTVAQVDSIMYDFMGINSYIKMNTLPYDGIHHIDMHFKLLDEETLLVGEYPSGISDGPQIEANLQYVLSNFITKFGTPFKVFRINMPNNSSGWPSAGGDYLTYTNSTILNKTIIVPVYSVGNTSQALNVYKKALPKGYNVVGINCDQIIQASGALHCITKEISSKDPLLISYKKLEDTYDNNNPYTVNAYIKHRSGIQNATLYYRTDSVSTFNPINMIQGLNSDYWLGEIPPQATGTRIQYYVKALSYSGKEQYRPLVAPQGYNEFNILGLTAINSQSININNIYPNPSKGITVIPINSIDKSSLKLTIYDLNGREIETQTKEFLGDQNFYINTTHYNSGVYIIEVRNESVLIRKKLIVR